MTLEEPPLSKVISLFKDGIKGEGVECLFQWRKQREVGEEEELWNQLSSVRGL